MSAFPTHRTADLVREFALYSPRGHVIIPLMKMTMIGLNAHLLSGEAGYRRAGIHGYIANTLRHLPDADPDLRYTVFVGEGTPPDSAQFTVRRSRLHTGRPTRRILWEQTLLPFQTGGLDLLHGMAFVNPALSRVPSVVTVYDLSFLRYPERLSAARRRYLRLMTRHSCQRARRVLTISQSTADDVHHLLDIPRDRIDVAVPGVSPDYHPLPPDEVAAFRARRNLPDQFILHLGTLEPRKNLPVLLSAYARLPADLRAEVPLVLVGGKGWGLNEVRATIVRLGLEYHVRLEGYAPDADLPLWYNAAGVLAYPSVFEGWGMPIVEALACGTPVAASDASSLPEAAGDAGLLLDANSVEAWTDGLQRALTDTAWRKSARERGLAHAAGLTWAATAAAHTACYHRALES
jgi:glycosyltransferase involved in cell wall biosynthesis